MEYPIIDSLAKAYIANGWSGLEVIEGTNLINIGSLLPVSLTGATYFGFPINSDLITYGMDNDITFKIVGNLGENKNQFALYLHDTINNEGLSVGGIRYLTNENNLTAIGKITTSGTIDITKNLSIKIYAQPYPGDSISIISGIMIAKGHVEEYIPYTPPTTDIFSRLKLPLPHYFPHPVIDALKRAETGTQTADDTEILQHYLTPLGIGGI